MIRLSPDVELTVENIKKFINNHRSCEFLRLKKLYDYYNTNNGYLPESAIDDSVVVLEPSIYNSKGKKLYHAIYEKEYSEDTKDT